MPPRFGKRSGSTTPRCARAFQRPPTRLINLPTRPRTINFPHSASHNRLPPIVLAPLPSPIRPRTTSPPFPSLGSHHRLPPLNLTPSTYTTRSITIAFPHSSSHHQLPPFPDHQPTPISLRRHQIPPISLRRHQLTSRSLSAATSLPRDLSRPPPTSASWINFQSRERRENI